MVLYRDCGPTPDRTSRKAVDPMGHPLTASTVVFNAAGRVLLLQHGPIWGFPRARIEFGETPAEAAARVVMERAGVVVQIVDPPAYRATGWETAPVPWMSTRLDALYLAVAASDSTEAGWFRLRDLRSLPVEQDVPILTRQGAAHVVKDGHLHPDDWFDRGLLRTN